MGILVEKVSDTAVKITDNNTRVSEVTLKALYQQQAMFTARLSDISEKIKQAEALGIKQ